MLGVALSIGCGDDPISASIRGNTDQQVSVPVGTIVSAVLFITGPGEFVSPPEISSSNLEFMDVAFIDRVVAPGGRSQRFRFKAMRRGQSVITFRLSDDQNPMDRIVVHTVDVL
jgi:hypothetical protein